MSVLFISDLHLTPERPQTNQLFLRFLEREAAHAESLFILGDLFEYWIGDDAVSRLGHGEIVDALHRFARTGRPLRVMRGNRDFLLGEGFAEMTGAHLLSDPSVMEVAGQRVLLTHGDRLGTDDTEHQQFRALVEQPDWRRRFLDLPLDERLNLAVDARARSEHNKSVNPMGIMDVNQAAVEQAFADHGVRLMIHGHTHRPAIHDLCVRGARARRIVLGDWYDQSSILRFGPDGVELTGAGVAARR